MYLRLTDLSVYGPAYTPRTERVSEHSCMVLKCEALGKVEHKYPVSFEMWCCWSLEKISWTDRVRNEVLHGVKVERNILHTLQIRKANWIGHILCRNCLLIHVIEGKIEENRRRARSRQVLGELKGKKQDTVNWKRKHEPHGVDSSLWTCRKTGYGMNGCEKKWRCPNLRNDPWREWENPWETSLMTSSPWNEMTPGTTAHEAHC